MTDDAKGAEAVVADHRGEDGLAAAQERVATMLDRFTHVELQVIVVEPPDATRLAARDGARAEAGAAGRARLLRDAVAAARDVTIRAFARGGFTGTWAATDMAVSVVRAEDRVAASAALEEAVIAEVVEDLVDDETLDVLRSTWTNLALLAGIPKPGALSTLAAPRTDLPRGGLEATVLSIVVVAAILVAFVAGLGIGLAVLLVGVAIVAGVRRAGRTAS